MNRVDIGKDLYGRLCYNAICQSYYDESDKVLDIINDTREQIPLYFKNEISNFLQDRLDILESLEREMDPKYHSLITGIYDTNHKFDDVDVTLLDSSVEFTFYYNLLYDQDIEIIEFEEFMSKLIKNSFIVYDIVDFGDLVARAFKYYVECPDNSRVDRFDFYMLINSYKKIFDEDQARMISDSVYNFDAYAFKSLYRDLIDELNDIHNLWLYDDNSNRKWYNYKEAELVEYRVNYLSQVVGESE